MNQSGVMVSALAAGFIVYLAINQKLGAYWSLLTGGGGGAPAPIVPGTTTPGTPGLSTNPFAGIPGLDPNAPSFWSNPFGKTPPATTGAGS